MRKRVLRWDEATFDDFAAMMQTPEKFYDPERDGPMIETKYDEAGNVAGYWDTVNACWVAKPEEEVDEEEEDE